MLPACESGLVLAALGVCRLPPARPAQAALAARGLRGDGPCVPGAPHAEGLGHEAGPPSASRVQGPCLC